MNGQIRDFGKTAEGIPVKEITLDNGILSCSVLTYGAVLRTLFVKDRDGKKTDIVLGYESLEEYRTQGGYLGAVVGRYANRIAGSSFELNGVKYMLEENDRGNHLHSASAGFSSRIWEIEEAEKDRVCLSLVSEDGDGGYPGTLRVRMTYALKDNALEMLYQATSDSDTVCNLTNHAYYNLAGQGSGDVLEQWLQIEADAFTPSDAQDIPFGTLEPVEGTPMDFREKHTIGERIRDQYIQLIQAGGYDHNFVLRGEAGKLRRVARAGSDRTGIRMTVESTLPGMQLYTANGFAERNGKNGEHYGNNAGFCLETQYYPDSPNKPEFPSCILKKGEEYEQKTVFRFDTV